MKEKKKKIDIFNKVHSTEARTDSLHENLPKTTHDNQPELDNRYQSIKANLNNNLQITKVPREPFALVDFESNRVRGGISLREISKFKNHPVLGIIYQPDIGELTHKIDEQISQVSETNIIDKLTHTVSISYSFREQNKNIELPQFAVKEETNFDENIFFTKLLFLIHKRDQFNLNINWPIRFGCSINGLSSLLTPIFDHASIQNAEYSYYLLESKTNFYEFPLSLDANNYRGLIHELDSPKRAIEGELRVINLVDESVANSRIDIENIQINNDISKTDELLENDDAIRELDPSISISEVLEEETKHKYRIKKVFDIKKIFTVSVLLILAFINFYSFQNQAHILSIVERQSKRFQKPLRISFNLKKRTKRLLQQKNERLKMLIKKLVIKQRQ